MTAATIDDQLHKIRPMYIDYRVASSIAVQLIAYKIVNWHNLMDELSKKCHSITYMALDIGSRVKHGFTHYGHMHALRLPFTIIVVISFRDMPLNIFFQLIRCRLWWWHVIDTPKKCHIWALHSHTVLLIHSSLITIYDTHISPPL